MPTTGELSPPGAAAAPPARPQGAAGASSDPTPAPAPTAAIPLLQRRTWASGAFLAAAARLVARGEETSYTLRRVVEWATAATGARRAMLWAFDTPGRTDEPLTMLAWAATDGWQPGDAAPPRPNQSPALMRAIRNPETVLVELNRPLEQAANWDTLLGIGPIALCAAISGGEVRGILAVAGLDGGADADATFGEDARAALAACAALAAIVFEREAPSNEQEAAPAGAPVIATAPAAMPASGEADPFLGLPNREAMLARLREEIGRAQRFGHPLTVLTLDADRLAEWEERGGDPAKALAHLVATVRGAIRDVDLLGRGDDDELILILPVSEVDDALRVGERVRTVLAETQPPDVDLVGDLRLTVSGGAVGHPDDGDTAESLLEAAEQTVQYAKRMGRDQIRMRGLGDLESPSFADAKGGPDGPVTLIESPMINQVFQGLMDALVAAGDANDQARPGHGRAVGRYARALAEACGLDPEQARRVEWAGMLHDAGKIGLPADVVGKPGSLTAEDRAILKEQPAVGKLMLQQIPALERVVPLVEYAHERFDGTGYPAGLSGNQIPFGARIIAIAEGYDAMLHDRPYRKALGHSLAIAELWREAGTRYDPRLIDTFVRLIDPAAQRAESEWNPALLEQVAVAPGPEDDEPVPFELDDDLEHAAAHWSVAPAADIAAEPEPAAPAEVPVVSAAPSPPAPPPAEAAHEPQQEPAPTEVSIAPLAIPATTATVADVAPTLTAEDIDAIEWYDDDLMPGAAPDTTPAPAPAAQPAYGAPPPPAPPAARPNTGSLILPQAAPPPTSDEGTEVPEHLSVDDTILVMSQTTLLRMAELGRGAKRRPGQQPGESPRRQAD